jgi:CRISPR-associated protein Csm2
MPQDYRDQPSVPIPDKGTVERIIAQGEPETLVKWAEDIGKAIARQVTSSQLRNVFGTARQIQLRWSDEPKAAQDAYRDAVLIRPKLGYYAKRERGRGMEDLRKILVPALEVMSQGENMDERKKRFDHFVDFFEAIVAYHKAYGGN